VLPCAAFETLFQLILPIPGMLLDFSLTLYYRVLSDMLDSNSSEDLTLSAFGGMRGGRRIMNTSQACVTSASMTVPLELLMISVEVSVS
jgi:hypothetical protein